ncbi:capsule biosynthesis GfcC family protein [Rheinheimera hassiensis]|uniref:capsule biosynthesis GfcC family protein n=1 Tax=Rheinheimera hassiensis TaxID=1193627 RepID=UPI001F0709C4|nr:capsule biosynthesis GfcC family protein [Rheinheimera hassiensis]
MKNLNMLKQFIFSALLIAPSVYAAVTVDINGNRYQFDTNPRLNEVLAPVALQNNWYWPAAALYQLDSDEPEQLRQLLLQQIVALKQNNVADSDFVTTLQSLERQLASWRLGKRIAMPIDYDFARIRPDLNPRFDNGAYLLQLKQRPASVYLFGAVSSAVAVPHRGAAAASDYLVSVQPTALADLSQLMLLQPDGTAQAVGSTYWNHSHIEAMPGAQVFIPLQSQLFSSQLDKLNKRLLELASHRVLP